MRNDISIAKLLQLSSLLLINFVSVPAFSQDWTLCEGPIVKHHHLGNFNLETNSRIEEYKDTNQYKFAIISCVSNNDKEYPIFVNWRTPRRTGWIPAGQKIDTPVLLVVKNDVEQLDGCLEYGNRGDFTSAPFFGTEADKKSIDLEKTNGCRAAATSRISASETTIENIILKFRSFFPSDVSRPDTTMLQIDGEVGIKKTGDNQYQSFFNYEVAPYKDSKNGVIKSITIKPAFSGPTEGLTEWFFKSNQKTANLASKGIIKFDVSEVNNPSLTYASYELYSEKNELIAAIELPVYISSPSTLKVGSK
ncbi:hypothetical protein [Pseudomonas sp. HS6]|uniref:hypothetical protein n=1 Tax=Pseudomonas sp. HS6 TaxID=2850559 RepID=UPI002019E06F|nr:hypothetical protein [Pseudomonas sp. HS6]UQS16599.1 hypothetical protein JJN09_06975 [Pseudomonas sp. HS6]